MSLNDRIRAFADPARAIDRESPYQAEGFIPTPPDALAELGSGNSVALREVVPELGSLRSAIVTYKRMTSNDAGVDVALRATKAPVLGAEFCIEPYDGADENLEIADFIRYNLFDGMRVPWLVVLEEVLRSFDYGFSILEKVYEQREWVPDRKGANLRKYTMLRKLSPRPASTIKEFIYDDNGGPVEVIQNAMDADKNTKEIKIPIDRPNVDAVIVGSGDRAEAPLLIEKTRADDFKVEIAHLAGVLEGTITASPLALERGLDTMMVIAAAFKSHETGRRVTIDWSVGYRPEALR